MPVGLFATAPGSLERAKVDDQMCPGALWLRCRIFRECFVDFDLISNHNSSVLNCQHVLQVDYVSRKLNII